MAIDVEVKVGSGGLSYSVGVGFVSSDEIPFNLEIIRLADKISLLYSGEALMSKQGRLHSLDHLRAHMMILGVVFHTSLMYYTTKDGEGWPVRDDAQSLFFSELIHLIHLFRMPVFFIVAGFFTAFILMRGGIAALLKDRFRRIALPLILFWPVLKMLSDEGLYFVTAMMEMKVYVWRGVSDVFFDSMSLHHLWFLYFLLIFYVMTAVPFIAINKNQSLLMKLQEKLQVKRRFSWKYAPLVLAIPAAIFNYNLGEYNVAAPIDWAINVNIVGFYYCFFVFGLLLYRSRNGLSEMVTYSRWWLFFIFLAFVLKNVGFNIQYYFSGELLDDFTWYGVYSKAIIMCCISLLVVNFYTKFMEFRGKLSRYVTDASYWIYLIHFPLTIWLPVLFMDIQVSAYVKFTCVVLLTMLISLISYHVFVRSTWLGLLLNGKKANRDHRSEVILAKAQ